MKKYEEYQVWYHIYTTAIQSLCNNSQLSIDQIIEKADMIANHAVEVFSKLEDKPSLPKLDNLDMQGIVDKVIKDATKRK